MRRGIGFCLALVALLFVGSTASYPAEKPSEGQINTFLRAVKAGDMAFVKGTLDRDREAANRENSHGILPLMCAIFDHQEEMVKLLVSRGADVNARFGPLGDAAYEGLMGMVEFLIANGAKIEHTNYWGGTPLASAAAGGRLEVARLLISKGANINAKDESGKTPLLIAVSGGHPSVAKLLMEKGADVNQANEHGTSPLHKATSAYTATLLIARGANVNAADKNGVTPLHVAAALGNVPVIQVLIRNGADLSAKTRANASIEPDDFTQPDIALPEGATPREVAEKAGQTEAANLLAKAEAG